MIGNALLELYHAGQGAVPARFQLACDEAVLGIGRVILTEGSIGGVPRRLEIAGHGLARLVASRCNLCLGRPRGLHRGRLHDGEQLCLDDVIDAQATERDATRLSVIEPAANAGVPRDLAFGSRVLDSELSAATSTPQQA